jgi:hypothetical protein
VAVVDVHRERRLVQDQQVRVVDERPPERQPPAQSSRQGAHAVASTVGEPDQLKHLMGPLLRRAEQVGGVAEVLRRTELVVERRLLGDQTDPPADVRRERERQGRPLPHDGALRRAVEAGGDIDDGGLASAVRAQQAEHLAGPHGHRERVEGEAVPESLGHRAEGDGRVAVGVRVGGHGNGPDRPGGTGS